MVRILLHKLTEQEKQWVPLLIKTSSRGQKLIINNHFMRTKCPTDMALEKELHKLS